MDVNGTKKLIYQLANSYRKGGQQKPLNIKSQGSDEVLTEPHEIKECWSNYFSSLLNVQQHQEELMTMSESTAVVEYHHITEHEVELAFEENVCDTCSIDVLILAADKLYIFFTSFIIVVDFSSSF